MREHATFVQAGIGERGDPRPGRIPGGDLTALMKQDQVFFQPYAVFPATVLAPADQRGRAVEPVRRKQDGNALRNHGGHSIKQRLLLAKSDTALRLLDPPRDRNGPLADPQAHHQAFKAIADLALVHHQNSRLVAKGRLGQNLRHKSRHHTQGINQRVLQPAMDITVPRVRILRLARQNRQQLRRIHAAAGKHACR